ncbi:MAG: DNA-binding domain-containing protein [Betaproteobacteria bacterium]
MLPLRDLQRGLMAATMFGDDAALASLDIASGTLGARSRIAVYRNNIFGNYRKVLAATYPVVRRLVGGPFFDAATEHFVRAYPSTRGDVNGYGGDLAFFLTTYAPARALAYLPDVARLEWAIDQAAIAADASPMDLAALAAVAPELLSELRMRVHPSLRLLVSRFPLLALWQSNQPDHDGDGRVDLESGGESLLVARGADGVAIERIARGAFALLAALSANRTLGDASEAAAVADAQFDLAAALRRLVANQILVAFAAPTARGSKRT